MDRFQRYNALEFEVMKEQSEALGRTGRALDEALLNYRRRGDSPINADEENRLLDDITEKLWALILQREFIGFVHENMEWIKRHYDIPPQVFSRLGAVSQRPPHGDDRRHE